MTWDSVNVLDPREIPFHVKLTIIVKVDGNDDTANILEEDELANEHAISSPTASGDAQEEEAFDLGGTMIIQVGVIVYY